MYRRRNANNVWQSEPGRESSRTEGSLGSSGTRSTCNTAESQVERGCGAAVQQQKLRPAVGVTLEIGEPGLALVDANNPIQESVGPSIATQPNRMSHNGPTAEADDASTPAGARTSPFRTSLIGEVRASARQEHQRQPLPTAPPRRIQNSNLDGTVSTESGPALGRKILQLCGGPDKRKLSMFNLFNLKLLVWGAAIMTRLTDHRVIS